MFSIVSEKHSSKVISFILDLLTPLIQQSDSVSQELMDIILSNIIEPFKVSALSRQHKVYYFMIKVKKIFFST